MGASRREIAIKTGGLPLAWSTEVVANQPTVQNVTSAVKSPLAIVDPIETVVPVTFKTLHLPLIIGVPILVVAAN